MGKRKEYIIGIMMLVAFSILVMTTIRNINKEVYRIDIKGVQVEESTSYEDTITITLEARDILNFKTAVRYRVSYSSYPINEKHIHLKKGYAPNKENKITITVEGYVDKIIFLNADNDCREEIVRNPETGEWIIKHK